MFVLLQADYLNDRLGFHNPKKAFPVPQKKRGVRGGHTGAAGSSSARRSHHPPSSIKLKVEMIKQLKVNIFFIP